MTYWLNHVTIDATGAGSHTADPSNPTAIGTVVDGSAFTPTAGRLLVCVVAGPVTSGTPTGWTLPSGGSAVSTDGLYVFYKTAAGSDTLVTGHNSGAYRVTFDFYEFPSVGSFVSAASFPGSTSGSSKSLSSLTGSNLVMTPVVTPGNAGTFSFTGSTKTFDYQASDGFHRYAIANVYSSASSVSVAATLATHEQIMFALAGLSDPDATVVAVAATATAAALPPVVTASSSVSPPATAASAAALAPVVSGVSGATVVAVPATATAAALPPTFTNTVDVATDTSNAFHGLDLSCTATVEVIVPVADPPVPISTVRVDKAVALPNPVLVKGRPT